MHKPTRLEQLLEEDSSPRWWISRRDRRGEPTCSITMIAGVRLQVYRHVAYPKAWTAYAQGLVNDVVLAAKEFEVAQREALALLEEAWAQLPKNDS